MAHGQKGEYDQAIADYTEAIRLDPKYAGRIATGARLSEKGEYDKAIADYTEAIRLKSERCRVYLLPWRCLPDKGEYDKAIADYTEAIRLDPKMPRRIATGAGPTTRRATKTRPSPT